MLMNELRIFNCRRRLVFQTIECEVIKNCEYVKVERRGAQENNEMKFLDAIDDVMMMIINSCVMWIVDKFWVRLLGQFFFWNSRTQFNCSLLKTQNSIEEFKLNSTSPLMLDCKLMWDVARSTRTKKIFQNSHDIYIKKWRRRMNY